MEQPVEVTHCNDDQGNLMYAVYVCEVTGAADVGIYGEPGDGIMFRSPEFADVDAAMDWAHEQASSLRAQLQGKTSRGPHGKLATADLAARSKARRLELLYEEYEEGLDE